MKKFVFCFLILSISSLSSHAQYKPNWESLDKRPLPKWYDEVKIGIFLHWGVFSVPSFGSEWFWSDWKEGQKKFVDFMTKNYKPGFKYQEFANDFTAEFFNATEWAEIFADSGAKYIVLTSKHHEGFALWPSKYCYSWNSKDVGPGKDLIGELAEAVRSKDLTFGLYHSLYEWFNDIYKSDKASNWTKREFASHKTIPELIELVENYKPDVIWSDGDWEAPENYWNATGFLAWLYNDSPVKDTVVVNDRWGIDIPCKHGDFYTCADRYNPGTLQKHKWENAMTIDKVSWGFRRNAKLEDYLTTVELLTQLASTVSCGGNILINVGPTKDGIIAPIFQERLRDLGKWLRINGEAIYSSKPWKFQNDSLTSNVWYTSNHNNVYAIVLFWPEGNQLNLESVRRIFTLQTSVVLLGNEHDELKYEVNEKEAIVKFYFPDKATVKSDSAYVLRIEGGASVQYL